MAKAETTWTHLREVSVFSSVTVLYKHVVQKKKKIKNPKQGEFSARSVSWTVFPDGHINASSSTKEQSKNIQKTDRWMDHNKSDYNKWAISLFNIKIKSQHRKCRNTVFQLLFVPHQSGINLAFDIFSYMQTGLNHVDWILSQYN